MMSRTLIFGFMFALVLQILVKIDCVPLSGVERESTGKQLDFPNENEIPGESSPGRPSIPRGLFPRRGQQSDGILNRIVNFFKRVLGLGTPSTIGPDGEEVPGDGGSPSENGILRFIRRTFGGLINRFVSLFGGGGIQTPGYNPDAAEFPYQRPSRQEPLRSRN